MVSFPIGRHEKSRVVLLAGIASEKIFSIVKQKVPLSVAGELGLQTFADQFDKMRHSREAHLRQPVRVEREGAMNSSRTTYKGGRKERGASTLTRSPGLIVSELKLGQGLDARRLRY